MLTQQIIILLQIKHVEVSIDRKMNLPAGSAYVEYNDSDSATKAEKYMNGGEYPGYMWDKRIDCFHLVLHSFV